jgi:cytochrome P450
MPMNDEKSPTFFDLLMTPAPDQESVHISQDSMVNHGLNLVGAGVDTVSLTFTVALYHILSSDIQRQLCLEIRREASFLRDELDVQQLRKLPYLVCSRSFFFFFFVVVLFFPIMMPDE